MKSFKKYLVTFLFAVAFAKPAHAILPLGNFDDPVFTVTPTTNTTISLVSVSSNAASTIVTATTTALGAYNSIYIAITSSGNVGGTLDMYLQVSPDLGTTWVDWAHLPQKTAGATSSNYSITACRYDSVTTSTSPAVVGINLSPALAANTVTGGSFTDRMRVVLVSGASTTAGSTQTVKIFASK